MRGQQTLPIEWIDPILVTYSREWCFGAFTTTTCITIINSRISTYSQVAHFHSVLELAIMVAKIHEFVLHYVQVHVTGTELLLHVMFQFGAILILLQLRHAVHTSC